MTMRACRKPIPFAVLATAIAPAPLIARDVPVAVAAPHDRVLPLQGGQNFRDLGGYPAAGGRPVKWGLLFRSGSMHLLTPADYTYLERRGIRTVRDFRSTEGRKAEPAAWSAAKSPKMLADDYAMASLGVVPAPGQTAEQARAMMTSSYPRMLTRFNSQYRRMFAELLAGRAPLAFNCSAGRDRTGLAAALLLIALGVPGEMVIKDYLLTNRPLDPQGRPQQRARVGRLGEAAARGAQGLYERGSRLYRSGLAGGGSACRGCGRLFSGTSWA